MALVLLARYPRQRPSNGPASNFRCSNSKPWESVPRVFYHIGLIIPWGPIPSARTPALHLRNCFSRFTHLRRPMSFHVGVMCRRCFIHLHSSALDDLRKGKCTYGDRCKFTHDEPAETTTWRQGTPRNDKERQGTTRSMDSPVQILQFKNAISPSAGSTRNITACNPTKSMTLANLSRKALGDRCQKESTI